MGAFSSVLDCQPHSSSADVDFTSGSAEAGGGRLGVSEIVFLGTGSSAGTPMISCVVNPDSECVACRLATRDGPTSKNYRGNPSLMIRYRGAAEVKDAEEEGGGTSGHRNIIIDCGKTFKASVLRFFPGIKERHIDALVITHEHADAMLGLDDVREVAVWGSDWRDTIKKQAAIPVHLSPAAMAHVQSCFPYLVTKPDESKGQVVRMVSQLEFNVVEEAAPTFKVGGLAITALPVMHGTDCVCYGFDFGGEERVVYLSDMTSIPEAVLAKIKARPVHVLILDALLPDKDATTHIGVPTALAIARDVQPKRLLLTGMSHSQGDHDDMNARLKSLSAAAGDSFE
eukprot:CAMPEP_0180371670 /NCGR_PEP_ID=MMETSP0989-20121125/19975_1 /TAXON_ID=697907 /ORGANISM="non described non described, Strain CCMP2293" /LENGTH=341 /DNA_ID=CAMNT_0022367773 /DNA_START=58 /DNA_END=1080 /DNA_ORIENTATION=+